MICKILNRANKRLAKQHEEIEELQMQDDVIRECNRFLIDQRNQAQDDLRKAHREIEELENPAPPLASDTALIEEIVELKARVARLKKAVHAKVNQTLVAEDQAKVEQRR